MSSADIAGVTVEWTIPPTTADVLEWRVWIACIETREAHAHAAFEWAARFVESSEVLCEIAGDYHAFLGLCERIAMSAELPAAVLTDLQRIGDKQNGIPANWTPTPACDCPRCRRKVTENPEGVTCMWDDIDPRAERAGSALLGLNDPSEPYYLTQIRAAQKRVEVRRMTHEREEREAKEAYKEAMKRGGGTRG